MVQTETNHMKKPLSCALLITLLVSASILVFATSFGVVQASAEVTGIIGSDTTWTKANSPYSLTGPVGVSSGVTLTIEHGVTVNSYGHYIQVNGTLVARGSSSDPIDFGGGEIKFTELSSDWNEETGSGCIIENMVSNTIIDINATSPKIANSSVYAISIKDGSPLISGNNLNNWRNFANTGITGIIGFSVYGGSPIVSNNNITGIIIGWGSPVIFGNNISRGSNNSNYAVINVYDGSPTISDNDIASGTYSFSAGFLYGSQVYPGIIAEGGNVFISDNKIYDCTLGIVAESGTIERNLIYNHTDVGIEIGNGIVQNNTVNDVKVGLKLNHSPSETTIIYNNFENCTQYRVYLDGTSSNINATYNWWGTADTQAINQTIFDFTNDFTLGYVTFVPFLTEPNTEAVPSENSVIPEFSSWLLLPLFLVATFAVVAVRKKTICRNYSK